MCSTPDDKWKPIKRDLLTPCRRPGLSRIIRTPLHGPENRESPVSYQQTSTPSKSVNSTPKNYDKPTKQKDTSTFKPEENNADSATKNYDKPTKQKITTTLKPDENHADSTTKNYEKPPKQKETSTFKPETNNSDAVIKNLNVQQTTLNNRSDNTILNIPKTPIVKISRCTTTPNTHSVKVKKHNRLSIKRSSSPEELNDFCNTLENIKPSNACELEDDETKIDETLKRIKLKEAQLEDLKRAAIYAKLHNVQELDELTLVWKQGCNKALCYLLEKLQEHCQIEMPILLRRLNISESVIETSGL
ncbi:hypothetical protein PPYR_04573 [Photinus pyralis]|uniref:Swi5-dependent recombination DNA repair protein 1 homolog n=1 Tax=Photinus pyralis TaxID=7054 RepID=A0A1Y1KZA3_PHOPY|nr:uncharacterized protein LOC116164150 [Photinus pyralis]KAB0802387.1 hypothetical protein PPYR_04573 [Photinus pyralis]